MFAIEARSHQQWLDRDLEALDRLMAPEFRYVTMNWAVEPKIDMHLRCIGQRRVAAPQRRSQEEKIPLSSG